jgi:peptidoglycan/LPS O-acetylase OafA/YrhL
MEKRHFIFLDGMRGFAALSVGFLHASWIFHLGLKPGHAYLAVDFFFCLSGFVIAYAYDDRLRTKMTFSDFWTRRLIRLYPMILIGILLGFIATLGEQLVSGTALMAQDNIILIITLFLLPAGLLFPGGQAYPMNNPLWSLFFELFANLLYGIQQKFRPVSTRSAFVVLLLSAIALIAVIFHTGGIETIGFDGHKSFLGGFVRVFYPFFAGVILYRYSFFNIRYRIHSSIVLAALLVALLVPIFKHAWLYDAVIITLGFPLMVMFGARSFHSERLSKFLVLFGRLSFPFYVIHQPVLRICDLLIAKTGLEKTLPYPMAALSLLVALAMAYAFLVAYDQPVRRWFTKKSRDSAPAKAEVLV